MKEMKFSLFVSLLALSIAFVISGHKIETSKTLNIASTDCLELEDEELKTTSDLKALKVVKASTTEELRVFPYHEVDVKPIYGSDCLEADNSWECTLEKLHRAIREKLDWPDNELERGEEVVEEITFVVLPDGSVGSEKWALSRNHNCHGCQQAAIDAVGKLDQWIPAVKDGRNVAVKMTLPIRFIPIS